MSTDAEWLRSWFDEHERGSGRPRSEGDGRADPGGAGEDADDAWRHGTRPARRRRLASLPVLAAAVVAVLAVGALTSALSPRPETPQLSVDEGSAPQTATAAGATPSPGSAPASVHPRPDAAPAAELAVHEHVTTSDGVRWVDAARTVALADVRGPADVVALVDAVVLDGAPLDDTADPAGPGSEPEWIGRRRARYAVPLLCESSCEAAATPWPVPAGGSATAPASTAAAALSAAGYRDARIEESTAVADGVEQLTVVARPPGVDAVERIVLWTGTDERGTEVVGMP